MRWFRKSLGWAALLALSCSSPTGVDGSVGNDVAAVSVDPPASTIIVGTEVPLHAAVMDVDGNVVPDAQIVWTVRDAGIATVSASGVVTGRAVGSTQVAASAGGRSAIASITVQLPPVATVSVLPAAPSLVVGASVTLGATLADAAGTTLTNRAVTWISSNVGVATVTDAGLVTAIAPGTSTITATSEGKTGTTTVTVTAVPTASVAVEPAAVTLQSLRTTTLTATVKDAAGNPLTGRPVKWTSSNVLVATVSDAGVVTGLLPGTATVSAAVDGKVGSATVTVTLVPVGTVAVQPKTASLTVGETLPLHAVVTDVNNAVTDRAVTWTSNNETAAKVSADGLVTALAPGQALITATSEGKSDAATVTVGRSPVGNVVVSPANPVLTPGETTTLAATVTDARGVPVTDRVVTWKSSDEAVAIVSAGVVTARTVGTATITATSEGKSGTASVGVTSVPVASVAVQPTTANLFVGETKVLQATVTDANGTIVADRPVTWLSNNTNVVTVSTTGLLTAVAPGSATITASAGGKSGSANVVVTLVPVGSVALAPSAPTVIRGQTVTLVPTIRDVNGAQVTRPISWATNNSAVATVSSTGVVTAVAPGEATITATSENKSGTATITVIPVPVGTVTVTPATKSLVAGTTTTLAVVVRDQNTTIVTDRVVAWSTSDPLVATVSGTGLVTAVAPGTATITATSEGKSDGSTITVTPVPVANVTVEPPTMTLTIGQTAAATAVLKDANGNVLTGRAVSWISSNPLVASVSATGMVTGVARGGPVFITASSEGHNGSTAVTVTEIPVGSVSLPATATLVAGQSTTLVPVVKDANGAVLTDRVVTWSSSNTNVATVSQTGVVKSLITGQATITATSEGKSGSTVLTVTPAPVGSVTLLPAAPTVASSSTVTIAATVKDVNGTTVTDRVVTWKSSDEAVATVSASGVVTGLKVGTATITATSESKSGTATVTVVPGPAATVTVAPAAATVRDGGFVQLSASAVDARGNPITGRAFTWTSNNGGVATVSSSGRVTGRKAGLATITATLDGADDSSQITVTP